LTASKILFGLLVNLLPESWPTIVAVDETLERRRGKKGYTIPLFFDGAEQRFAALDQDAS